MEDPGHIIERHRVLVFYPKRAGFTVTGRADDFRWMDKSSCPEYSAFQLLESSQVTSFHQTDLQKKRRVWRKERKNLKNTHVVKEK